MHYMESTLLPMVPNVVYQETIDETLPAISAYGYSNRF